MPHKALAGTLRALAQQSTQGRKVSVRRLVKALKQRGFGPLLMLPAFLVILPTGALPGVPFISGVFICLISGQMMAGRKHPWFPAPLMEMKVRSRTLRRATKKALPFADKIDPYARPRLEYLVHPVSQRFIALSCFCMGLLMMLLGFVPLLPACLGVPILFYAWGLSAKDGALTLIGMVLTTLGAAFLFSWLIVPDDQSFLPDFIPRHAEIIAMIKEKWPA